MFSINFNKLINDNLSFSTRQVKRVKELQAGIKGIKDLYADFIDFRDEVLTKVHHNGQVIYLEKRLNDKYDPNFQGIWIDSNLYTPPYFIHKKAEVVPQKYMYKRWNPTYNYVPGDRAVRNNIVYICVNPHTNIDPLAPPGLIQWWSGSGPVRFMRKRSEFLGSLNFIVYVPQSVVFDINEMKSIINYYKQAGKNYSIIIY